MRIILIILFTMKKEDIFSVYERYENAVMENSKNVVTNWSAMYDWLFDNLKTKEEKSQILHDMFPAVIYIAVNAVNMGDIKLKSLSDGQWSTTDVQKGYDIIRDIRRAFDADGTEQLAYHFKRFLKLLNRLNEKPACQLYLWKCYAEDDRGLLEESYNKVRKMIEAYKDEQWEKSRVMAMQEACMSMSRE